MHAHLRKKLVVGNWKMHGNLDVNRVLLKALIAGNEAHASDLAVCAPAPYLRQCAETLRDSGIAWGAQDVSEHEAGAFTGEVSASMLRDLGCRYVLVGHSERRAYHAETDRLVALKAMRAMAEDVMPIVCVGETLEERESGATDDVVTRQLQTLLDTAPAAATMDFVIAYEPVWAIGTGKTPTAAAAQDVHRALRTCLERHDPALANRTRILYGGSMKAHNAAELFAMPDIDGGLVGGASLDAAEFLAIASLSARQQRR